MRTAKPLKVVCTIKTLAIGFNRFPRLLCDHDSHDRLSGILSEQIPEIDRDGLDGGMYRQCKALWITIECEGMTEERYKEIESIFASEVEKFCYPRRLKCRTKK